MKKTFFIMIVCIILITGKTSAQDAIFSQYDVSSLYLNPAFAGLDFGSRLTLNYRNHPFPDMVGYSSIFASFDTYQPKVYGGLGLIVLSDNQGDLYMRNHIAGMYAYHLRADENLYINFGVQAGYYRQDVRWDKLDYTNPNQEPPDQSWQHSANFAAGILVYNDVFWGGIAAHHLTQPSESIFENHKLQRKFTAHVGFFLEPGEPGGRRGDAPEYFISPGLLYQQQGEHRRVNVGLHGGINRFMAGAWLRHDFNRPNAMIFLVGLRFDNYRFGYSYDHSFSGYSDLFHAIHELTLTISFAGPEDRGGQRVIRHPGL